jgi:hypothetical protein
MIEGVRSGRLTAADINRRTHDHVRGLLDTREPDEVWQTLQGIPLPQAKAAPIPEPVVVQPPTQTWNVDVHIPAPIVNVDIPATVVNVDVPPTVVNVEPSPSVVVPAPIVNVEAAQAPIVNVEAPTVNIEAPHEKASADMIPVFVANWPGPKDFVVKRDQQGRMTRVEEQ